MRILWDNKAEDATVEVLTENANFPKENLQDTRLSKRYRSTADANQRIVFGDVLTQITASYMVLLAHNLTDAATVTLQATDDSDSADDPEWGSPSIDTVMVEKGDMYILNFNEATHNFWSILIDDSANPDTYVEVGFVFLSTYLQMPGMAVNQSIPTSTESTSSISNSGQLYGNEKYEFRTAKINHPFITNAQKTLIKVMWTAVKNVKPFILIIWATDMDFEPPIYAKFTKKIAPYKRNDLPNSRYGVKFEFREVF